MEGYEGRGGSRSFAVRHFSLHSNAWYQAFEPGLALSFSVALSKVWLASPVSRSEDSGFSRANVVYRRREGLERVADADSVDIGSAK